MNLKSTIVKQSFFDTSDLIGTSKIKGKSLWLTEVL